MANIFATWICIDTPEHASYFPSSKGNSQDYKTQNIYWRCLIVCFYTVRKYNPGLRLALFSNVKEYPTIDNISIKDTLDTLNVECYNTPFGYQTPENYYNNWRNQFYEFSIFKYLLEHTDFENTDSFVLVDSDCIVTGNLDRVYQLIEQNECITYIYKSNPSYKINGNSRLDMKDIFENLQGYKMDYIPYYHAGEFFGATIESVRKLMNVFYPTWDSLLHFFNNNQPHLHEEAHVLSYLYYTCGYKGGEANHFIKRLWTDPASFRNVEKGDENFLIWHLPAEKRFGFKKMFLFLEERNFDLKENFNLVQYMKKNFQVPVISNRNIIFYLAKRALKKFLPKK